LVSPFNCEEFARLFDGVANTKACFNKVNHGILGNSTGFNCVFYKPFPFFGYAVIYGLPKNQDTKELNYLLSELIRQSKSNNCWFLEVRNHEQSHELNILFSELGFNYRPWLNATLDLHRNWQLRISENKRRNIQKAINLGLKFRKCSSSQEINAAYKIFEFHYKRIRKPLPGRIFFENCLNSPNYAFIFVTYRGSEILASSLVLCFQKVAAQYYFATDYNHLSEHQSASFHQWSVLNWAHQNGIIQMDLVGGGDPDKRYGVREFKRRFGATFDEVGRWEFIFKPIRWNILKSATDLILRFKK